MIDPCCINALQHGMALDSPHIGCGDCGNEWSREGQLKWENQDGIEVSFAPDEIAHQVSKRIEPDSCCLEKLTGDIVGICILKCECGIHWTRPRPDIDTWSAYKEAEQ